MFQPLDIPKTGLKKETIEKIQECISRFPEIAQVVLYGSRALGTFRPGSDIDLCLFGEGLDSTTTLKLDNALDDLMLPYTFDISIYEKIENPNFKEHIDRVGVVFWGRGS